MNRLYQCICSVSFWWYWKYSIAKYGNAIQSSNFRTMVTAGFWINILLTNFAGTAVSKFCWISVFFSSVSTLKWNLEKLDTSVKLLRKSVYTKPNLSSSATKLLKLDFTPMNLSFLKTLAVTFFLQFLISRKEKELSFSVSNENLIF